MSVASGYDLLLLLLYANPEELARAKPVRGTTRLMKEFFLLAMAPEFREKVAKEFAFEAYDFGPFSPSVREGVDVLTSHGLIRRDEEALGEGNIVEEVDDLASEVVGAGIEEDRPPKKVAIYQLSEKGQRVASALWERLTADERGRILAVKRDFNELPLRSLLRYVYEKYPAMRVKSKILWELGFNMGSAPGLKDLENED